MWQLILQFAEGGGGGGGMERGLPAAVEEIVARMSACICVHLHMWSRTFCDVCMHMNVKEIFVLIWLHKLT